jgi:Xaa-Pro aminopeptidase
VVTEDKAALWTDGRYFLQASQELSDEWSLMKAGLPDTPSIAQWLLQQLAEGGRVGIEAQKVSYRSFHDWSKELRKESCGQTVELVPLGGEIIAHCWPDRPSFPLEKAFPHPLKYSGQECREKLSKVREELTKKKADLVALSSLDEIACALPKSLFASSH